jgi:ectoine hydroxylase-related dioxygenase (phytanoyl-CoA dioxygenase family)
MAVMSAADVQTAQQGLEHDGYLVLRAVVSPDRLSELGAAITAEYERVKTSGTLFKGGGTFAGHLNCFPGEQSRFVYDELRERGIVDVARATDPVAAAKVRATMNFNLPGSVAQHYHIDGLYTEAFLICNIAVVDTTLENGAIDVLPGTNREFYKFHRYALGRKYKLSTRVEMNRGDVLLRMSTTWHRGMPNRTTNPRPFMSITFGERSAPEGDPFMVNDGKAFFFANWFSTSTLGQLRERTFVKLPWTYSTYRFARSLHGNRGYSSW